MHKKEKVKINVVTRDT